MRFPTKHTRPSKFVFCLLLTFVLLLLTVFAAIPENGGNTPMLGSDHSTSEHGGMQNKSGGNQSAGNTVTDAAGAVGDAVSEAGSAAGDIIGEVGDAAGELVSDAGNAVGNAADAIGGTVGGNSASDNGTAGGDRVDQATPFDTHAVDNGAGASGTVTTDDAPAGMNWILILILIAAAAAIFFLILMPRRSREM